MLPSRQGWMFAFVVLLSGFVPATLRAEEPVPFARVEGLFRQHCYSCHAIEKPKGKLRIDNLDTDFIKGTDEGRWKAIVDRLELGDMPPEDEPELKKEDRDQMIAWIAHGRRLAAVAKNPETSFRRLTRREYER